MGFSVPEQSLTLVGNSVSFEGYVEADMIAVGASGIATFQGFGSYVQPPEMNLVGSSGVATFAIDNVKIRDMIAVGSSGVATFYLSYPANEILYFSPQYEV